MSYLGPPPARTPVTSAQITDASVTAAKLATDSVTTVKIAAANVTTAKITDANVTAAKLAASSALVGKNIIINGSHEVAQRGAAITGMGAASAYTPVDMWHIIASGTAGRVTGSQVAGPLAATGHGNAVKIDVTTVDSSVASGDIMSLRTSVEAQNLQQLQWGVATAKSVTLSFWMKSPKAGTHCVSIYQEDDGRYFIREFTIASADTYEYFAITFPGDTGGVIDTNNGAGIRIDWPLICGSGEAGSADAWTSGGKFATGNQQNLLDSTDNNVELAGVQLELGTVATDFEHEDFGVTYLKCKRYLPFYFDAANNSNFRFAFGAAYSTSYFQCILPFLVPPRAAVTISVDSIGNWRAETGDGTGITVTAIATQPSVNADNFGMWSTANFQSSSGYTAKEPGFLRPNGTSGIMIASCEL